MDASLEPKSGRARILVVEDSPTQLEELRFVLEDAGFDVVVAANGKEGLEMARTAATDMIITDIVMPEMDGYALCRAVRKDEKLRRLPVMLLTSLSDPLDVIRGLESGADNFLRKPFEADSLLARIRNILGTAQLRKTAGSEAGLTIRFRDKDYYLGQERLQLLDALLSAFDSALCVAPFFPDKPIEGTRVLVVEDSPTETQRLRFVLEGCGCDVVTAANGLEGLEAFRAAPMDLVISDVVMPEMDGYELCKAIRADEHMGDVPVVLVSALADPQDLIAGLEAGATNFVRKPFNDRYLSTRVGNLLASREARGASVDARAIDILYEGQRFSINADRAQILDLLLSSYDNAVQQNAELSRTRDELQTLTERLEVRVAERTATLRGEIEQRKQSEQRAAQAAREWQETFDTSASAIWVLDAEGRVVRANKPTERLFGNGGQVTGKYCWEVAHGTERPIPECPNQRARESLRRESMELLQDEVWLEVVVDPILDDAGHYCGAVHTVSDITARKQAEQSLRLTQFSVDHAADSIIWSDVEGRLIAVNDSICRSLGYERDELLTMTLFDLDPSLTRERWSDNWKRLQAEGDFAFETVHARKDGTTFPVEVIVNHVVFEDQELNCAFVRDITESNLAKKELRESELKFRTVADAAYDWIYWLGSEGEIVYCSPSAERITGYRPDDFRERPDLIVETIHPEDRAGVDTHLSEPVPKASHQAEYRIVTREGEVRWIEHLCGPVYDDEGHWRGRYASNRDITEQKLAESALRESEEQLRQSQKMEAVGQLAGGIAHDFNNLLTAILGYSDLLLTTPEIDGSSACEDVREIKHAAERASALTRQILAFSRRQAMNPKVVSLNEVLAGMEPLLRRTLGENIDLVSVLRPDLGYVEADVHQFEQVILNLAVNARDAMPVGGRLTLETANVELSEDYCYAHPEADPGSHIMLSVSDTGIGMDETVRGHAFEPFFTTKAPGEGTGLGLATVYGIVKQSNGSIFVYSEPGEGTSFKIYLPRVDAPAAKEDDEAAGQSEPARGDETVLVVEDEAAIRNLIARVLSDMGYRVETTATGEEALQALADSERDPDLLLTDLILPGTIQGKDVADMAQASKPDMPVVYMSGYTRNAIVHAGRLDEGVNFLSKPFTPGALAKMIRRVLDGRGPRP